MARLEAITSKNQVPAEDHAVVDNVIKSRGGVQGPFTMFMHCPKLAQHLVDIGGYIRFEGKLDHRPNEQLLEHHTLNPTHVRFGI